MNRRGFLKGILAAATAPYVVTTAGVLMPVRDLWKPQWSDDFETILIEPGVKDKSDPLGQRGYFGAQGVFDGKRYGVVNQIEFKNYSLHEGYDKALCAVFAINQLKQALADPRVHIPIGSGMMPLNGQVVLLESKL